MMCKACDRDRCEQIEAENARLREERDELLGNVEYWVRVAQSFEMERDELREMYGKVYPDCVKHLQENARLREERDHYKSLNEENVRLRWEREAERDRLSEEVEMWKARAIFARSEVDRLVLERRAESGTF